MDRREEFISLLDALRLSQRDAAALLERSENTVSRYVTGAYAVPQQAVQRLRDVQRIRALTAKIDLLMEERA